MFFQKNSVNKSETKFLGFIWANYQAWFLQLPDQSLFNRRLRSLGELLKIWRLSWVKALVAPQECHFLVNTKPIPVPGLNRDKRHSDFSDNTTPDYYASRQLYYFGYKFTLLRSWDRLPIAYDLAPDNTEKHVAVETVLDTVRGSTIYSEKGFIDAAWQVQLEQRMESSLWNVIKNLCFCY